MNDKPQNIDKIIKITKFDTYENYIWYQWGVDVVLKNGKIRPATIQGDDYENWAWDSLEYLDETRNNS